MTGASDGTLALWSQTKKRPTSILRRAHGYPKPGLTTASHHAVEAASLADNAAADGNAEGEEPVGPGSVGGDAASWIGSVGVCRGTDLVVRHNCFILGLVCLIMSMGLQRTCKDTHHANSQA